MNNLLDATIRRDAQLLRFGTYLKSKYINPTMQRLSREIPSLLTDYQDLSKFEQKKLAREIRELIDKRMTAMFESITKELHGMTAEEAEFIEGLYEDFTGAVFAPVVATTAIKAADGAILSLEKNIGKTVGLWSELLEQNKLTAIKEVDAIVRDGFRAGRTLNDMAVDLRGTYNKSTKSYMGGILNGVNANRAEALARTGVSHYSNRARDSFAETNKKIIPESVFFATLDNRTTTQCLHFHLSRWKNDDPKKPVLPLHFGERSVYLFAGNGIDPLEGTRPVIGGKKGAADEFESRQDRTDKKVKYKGRKDLDVFTVDQVSAKVTAQKWLERQPRFFVESTLGKTRAKLFLDGGLKIDKFTNLQGRPLTLEELRATAEGERAWRRAGLD